MSLLSAHKLICKTKQNKTKQTHSLPLKRKSFFFRCRINLHGALNLVNYTQGHAHTFQIDNL